MPDRVVKLVKNWGMQPKNKNMKNKMELLNFHGKKLDWDNKEIEEDENVVEFQQKLMHPDIIAKISGVELENDYENTVGPALHLKK